MPVPCLRKGVKGNKGNKLALKCGEKYRESSTIQTSCRRNAQNVRACQSVISHGEYLSQGPPVQTGAADVYVLLVHNPEGGLQPALVVGGHVHIGHLGS